MRLRWSLRERSERERRKGAEPLFIWVVRRKDRWCIYLLIVEVSQERQKLRTQIYEKKKRHLQNDVNGERKGKTRNRRVKKLPSEALSMKGNR